MSRLSRALHSRFSSEKRRLPAFEIRLFRDVYNCGRLNIWKCAASNIANRPDDGILNSVRRIDPNQMSDERSEGLLGGEGDPGRVSLLETFDHSIGALP